MKLPQPLKKKIVLLKQKKYRDEYGEFVIEGFKIVEEAIKSNQPIEFIVLKESLSGDFKIGELLKKNKANIYFADEKDFKQISSLETPPGILVVLRHVRTSETLRQTQGKNVPFLILDSIKDPGNLGTIIRTADWFGFENIVVGDDSVDVYNPKVLQSTMGSIFHINFEQNKNTIELIGKLKNDGYKIIATDLAGNDKKPAFRDDKFAIVIGSESFGINKEILKMADYKYKISGTGKAESLNAAVATGIVLYEFSQKAR